MTKLQRLQSILTALGEFAFAGLILCYPENGYGIVTMIITMSLIFAGFRELFYWLRMARHMVGGRTVLYRAFILLDFAFFTFSIIDIPKAYVLIYLSILFGFYGLVDLLRVNELRNMESSSWKLKALHGLVCMVTAVLCLLSVRSGKRVEIIYVIALCNSAVIDLMTAFRRSAVIYIP